MAKRDAVGASGRPPPLTRSWRDSKRVTMARVGSVLRIDENVIIIENDRSPSVRMIEERSPCARACRLVN